MADITPIVESEEGKKQLIINAIIKSMEQHNIKVEDLPGGVSLRQKAESNNYSYCEMLKVGKTIYDKLCDKMGKKDAYMWAEDNILSAYRTEMEIKPYRNYKIVDVSITCSVVVPNNFEEADVKDVVSNLDLYNLGDWEFGTVEEDLEEWEIGHFDYINSECDFLDGDFDE